jgi:hypothetical protein
LAPTVLERFRKRNSTIDCGANLVAVTSGVHRRHRQGFLKDHLLSGAAAGVVERGLRPFTPAPAFPVQRQFDEQ